MTFRQLEANINVWENELTELESEFHDQASRINRSDSLLINNASQISQLNETVERLKTEQANVDRQLDFVIYQQNELEKLLQPLEKTRTTVHGDPASSEREFTYNLLESVNNDLQGIGVDIESFIKKLNETKSSRDPADPLAAISKVLNAHMDALVYIESQVQSLRSTLDLK
jgi:chromosome segregation ATPase